MLAMPLTFWLVAVGAPLGIVTWWFLSRYERTHPIPSRRRNRFY